MKRKSDIEWSLHFHEKRLEEAEQEYADGKLDLDSYLTLKNFHLGYIYAYEYVLELD